MKKPKLTSYAIMAKVSLDCSITIDAASLEDALARATEYTEEDFVKVLGEWNDGSMEIYGVYKS